MSVPVPSWRRPPCCIDSPPSTAGAEDGEVAQSANHRARRNAPPENKTERDRKSDRDVRVLCNEAFQPGSNAAHGRLQRFSQLRPVFLDFLRVLPEGAREVLIPTETRSLFAHGRSSLARAVQTAREITNKDCGENCGDRMIACKTPESLF